MHIQVTYSTQLNSAKQTKTETSTAPQQCVHSNRDMITRHCRNTSWTQLQFAIQMDYKKKKKKIGKEGF